MKLCFQFTIRVYVCACETGEINVFKPLSYKFYLFRKLTCHSVTKSIIE